MADVSPDERALRDAVFGGPERKGLLHAVADLTEQMTKALVQLGDLASTVRGIMSGDGAERPGLKKIAEELQEIRAWRATFERAMTVLLLKVVGATAIIALVGGLLGDHAVVHALLEAALKHVSAAERVVRLVTRDIARAA